MDRYYKFLRTEHIDGILDAGTILISNLSFFRALEKKEVAWIADRQEGATVLTLPDKFVITENSPELEQINKANIGLGTFGQFAKVESGGMIIMGGNKFVHQTPNFHIFSFSRGGLGPLTDAMCVTSEEPYDACLEIRNPKLLLKSMLDDGACATTGEPMSKMFKCGSHADVVYEEVTRDIGFGPVIEPHPFRKAPAFAAQSEHRFVFEPSRERLPDRILVKIPDPRSHFSEEFRSFGAQKPDREA